MRKGTPKRFLPDGVIKPGLAILFFLAFGLPFVFFGFQSVDLRGHKDVEGQINIIVSRSHLWGLIKYEHQVTNVQGVEMRTSSKGVGNSKTVQSQVVLVSDSGVSEVFIGSSNVDNNLKDRVIEEVSTFINDSQHAEYIGSFSIQNVFGWVGLPFLAIGLLGLVCWPWNMFTMWKQLRR